MKLIDIDTSHHGLRDCRYMHNQPPKFPLHEASLREATGERPHIYIVHHK